MEQYSFNLRQKEAEVRGILAAVLVSFALMVLAGKMGWTQTRFQQLAVAPVLLLISGFIYFLIAAARPIPHEYPPASLPDVRKLIRDGVVAAAGAGWLYWADAREMAIAPGIVAVAYFLLAAVVFLVGQRRAAQKEI